MDASLQPTNILHFTPIILKENNIKKQKFMKNRFPKLKGLVYRYVQFLSFMKKTSLFLIAVEQANDKPARIVIVTNLFTYLYNTRDIWTSLDKFSITVKKKMIELTLEEPTALTAYLLRFGYICPYPKSNQICGKEVDGTLCKTHSKCLYKIIKIICTIPNRMK
jgi:hypothetical protein